MLESFTSALQLCGKCGLVAIQKVMFPAGLEVLGVLPVTVRGASHSNLGPFITMRRIRVAAQKGNQSSFRTELGESSELGKQENDSEADTSGG